jgi:hypothetical protein
MQKRFRFSCTRSEPSFFDTVRRHCVFNEHVFYAMYWPQFLRSHAAVDLNVINILINFPNLLYSIYIFYAIKSKGNKLRMAFVTFADSSVSVGEDGSIKTQRTVKRLFERQTTMHAKSGTLQSLITWASHFISTHGLQMVDNENAMTARIITEKKIGPLQNIGNLLSSFYISLIFYRLPYVDRRRKLNKSLL